MKSKLMALNKFIDEGAGYGEKNLIYAIDELIAHLTLIREQEKIKEIFEEIRRFEFKKGVDYNHIENIKIQLRTLEKKFIK